MQVYSTAFSTELCGDNGILVSRKRNGKSLREWENQHKEERRTEAGEWETIKSNDRHMWERHNEFISVLNKLV